MEQTKEGCLAFLAQAREALDQLSLLADQESHLIQEERRLERQLETEKKAVADNIRQTVKKREEEVSSSYDKEITKGQDHLKKARSKREKAKSQGVKERIEEETGELRSHNRELRLHMKGVFQQKRVPGLCKSALFYSLYFPRWFKEIMILILFLLIFFLAVPCGVYQLVPEHQLWHLVVIYLLDVMLVGGLYVLVGNKTRMHHLETLKEGRGILDQIHSNNKKIKVITSTIRKDRNESLYDLKKFDDEIAQAEQELSDVAAKKRDALNTFENVTRNILADEIEHNSKDKLDKLQAEYQGLTEQLKNVSAQVKTRRLSITDQYSTYLGKEFLDAARITELSSIIQDGQAANLSEAIEACKAQEKNKI